MSAKRVTQTADRTPQQAAELRAVRSHYQATRPTIEQALADAGESAALPLGAVVSLHQLLALLRTERERQQVTLAQLAERTGMDQAALSRLETGKADNPTLDTVFRVAAGLGKTVGCVLRDAA